MRGGNDTHELRESKTKTHLANEITMCEARDLMRSVSVAIRVANGALCIDIWLRGSHGNSGQGGRAGPAFPNPARISAALKLHVVLPRG